MFNSSSKLHTANMKLFLLTVVCFAVALAAPADKRKRDILPGDPRYGTDYHHKHHEHHENEVEVSRAAGGYVGSYSVPETGVSSHSSFHVKNTYGPPDYQPGVPISTAPINNDYLAPVVEDKHPVVIPTYEEPSSTVHVPNNRYLEPVIENVKTTHKLTHSYGPPVKHEPTVHAPTFETEHKVHSVGAPITSYGTPVVDDVKTVGDIHESIDSTHANTVHKTVQTEVVKQRLVENNPHVKVEEHAPVVQGVTKYTEVKNVHTPVVHAVHSQPQVYSSAQSTGHYGGLLGTTGHFGSSFGSTGHFDSGFGSSVRGFEGFPSYDFNQHYSQPSFDHSAYSGFGGFGSQQHGYVHSSAPAKSVDHHVHIHIPESLTGQVTKHVSHPVPAPQTYEVSRPSYTHVQQPVQVSHPVSYHAQPVQQYVETKTPVVHQHSSVQKTGPITEFFQNFQVPSLPSLPSFPSVPFNGPTTQASVQKEHTSHVVDHESVVVENPLLRDQHVHEVSTHATPVQEYVQPTASNGGYVY